ncbi:MAG: RIP metalloprotease RseP [Alphaproteobacteria bacterium]|nr:RIP metalloprotease RseP [Alphaproteobacteria bacterium]
MDILAAVLMVALLVFIHEFGHFIVAKACGIHVPVFSIGFGRRVVGFKLGGTDYRLSLIPFGGYVKMAGANFGYMDEDEDDLPDDPGRGFMRRPVWQRLLVVAAGPAFNLALPLVVFTALLMAGEPQPAAVIGSVDGESPAEQAGLLPGDTVLTVDGVEVQTWTELVELVHEGENAPHELVLLGIDGRDRTVTLTVPDDSRIGISHSRPSPIAGIDDPRSPAGRAGIETGDTVLSVNGVETADWVAVRHVFATAGASVELVVDGEAGKRTVAVARDETWTPAGSPLDVPEQAFGILPATLFVGTVGETVDKDPDGLFRGCTPSAPAPPTPASLAGIEPGDRFLAMDGKPVIRWGDVLDAVSGTMEGEDDQATARQVDVQLIRDGQILTLQLTPEIMRDTDSLGRYYYRPILGVTRMGGFVEGPETRVYYGFGAAVGRAAEETAALMGFIVEQLGKLVTGEAAVQKSLGGPVEIVRQASHAAEKGLFVYARLAGMLSISLGIVNLLPVPVLDGGQLLFFLVEAVRGRPLSHRLRERAQQVGVLFLVLLMLSVLVFDIGRLLDGGGG